MALSELLREPEVREVVIFSCEPAVAFPLSMAKPGVPVGVPTPREKPLIIDPLPAKKPIRQPDTGPAVPSIPAPAVEPVKVPWEPAVPALR